MPNVLSAGKPVTWTRTAELLEGPCDGQEPVLEAGKTWPSVYTVDLQTSNPQHPTWTVRYVRSTFPEHTNWTFYVWEHAVADYKRERAAQGLDEGTYADPGSSDTQKLENEARSA
jgi:hypothetical protein